MGLFVVKESRGPMDASIRSRSVRRLAALICGLFATVTAVPAALQAQSLRGSRTSLAAQQRQARQHDFTLLEDAADVRRFVRAGLLVRVEATRDLALADVSFPYARPAVQTFVERLAAQYRRACSERLVVTSLTRPTSRQPANASHLSVHPTGMALDLRQSRRAACRAWLERTLLDLEEAGVLEATRERWPAHYHVALFPAPYTRYLARRGAGSDVQVAAAGSRRYTVKRGDTLWDIARRHGTTLAALKSANGTSTTRLKPGQVLIVPGGAGGTGGGAGEVRVAASGGAKRYKVGRGDSLWAIARRHKTTVTALKNANGIRSTRLKPGQMLEIPSTSAGR